MAGLFSAKKNGGKESSKKGNSKNMEGGMNQGEKNRSDDLQLDSLDSLDSFSSFLQALQVSSRRVGLCRAPSLYHDRIIPSFIAYSTAVV